MGSHFIEVPSVEEIQWYLDRHTKPFTRGEKLSIEFTADGFEDDFGLESTTRGKVLHFISLKKNDGREDGEIEIPICNQGRKSVKLTDDIAKKIHDATHQGGWISGRIIIDTQTMGIEILGQLFPMNTL